MNTCRHLQAGEGIYRLLGRCGDIDQSLMGPLLELLSGILVLMNRTKDGNHFLLCGKRDWSGNLSSALADCFNDLFAL